ncbi:MAG: PAS domain S-box protein [Armatimonadetes bacterium]|nr:PAS domain S-box protein [Armatimonadota bacterium]
MSQSPRPSEAEITSLQVSNTEDYAIFALGVDGEILTWNRGAECLLGLKRNEAVGQPFALLCQTLDTTPDKPEEILSFALSKGRYEEQSHRHRPDGSTYWIEFSVSPLYDGGKAHVGYSVVAKDISDIRKSLARERLIHNIATISAEAGDHIAFLWTVMSQIGHYFQWQVGHVFLREKPSGPLKSTDIWYCLDNSENYRELIEVTKGIEVEPNVGTPGRALATKKVVFVPDLFADDALLRFEQLVATGLTATISIPILVHNEVFAIIEFATREKVADTVFVVDLAEVLSAQISQIFELRRALDDQMAFDNASRDLLCWVGYDAYFKFASPSWSTVLGYTPEEVLKIPWPELVHPDELDTALQNGRRQIEEGATVEIILRFKHKDGSFRSIEWHSVPLPEREMIYAIGRDVTQKIATERQLQETLALQNAVLNASHYGIICVNLEGAVTVFNKGAERILGYTAEEFVGVKGPPRLTDPTTLAERASDLSKALGHPVQADVAGFTELAESGIDQEFEWTYIRKDGTRFPGLLAVSALRDESGEMNGYMGIIQDITKRREAEDATERLLAIVSQSPDLIGFIDSNERIVYQNLGGNRMLGYADDFDFVGQDVTQFMTEAAVDRARNIVVPAILEHGIWTGESEFVRQDGSRIPVSQVIFFLPNKDGEPPYIATIARDITEFKRSQAQMSLQAQKLQHSNQELEQFAYVASHDLQEPLRMVCSFLGLLEIEFDDQLTPDAREYIRYAVDGGMRMRSLIDGLLDFSRVGRQNLALESTSMELALQDAVQNLKIAVAESGATVTHSPLPRVMGDRSSLTRLLQNLVGNSIKFRADQPPQVHVGVEDMDGDEYRFWIEDNGIGIDPKHEEKIFLIFQRLHARDKYPGNGIGLSICRKIVERHGGKLWLDKEKTGGARFYFTLKKGT